MWPNVQNQYSKAGVLPPQWNAKKIQNHPQHYLQNEKSNEYVNPVVNTHTSPYKQNVAGHNIQKGLPHASHLDNNEPWMGRVYSIHHAILSPKPNIQYGPYLDKYLQRGTISWTNNLWQTSAQG